MSESGVPIEGAGEAGASASSGGFGIMPIIVVAIVVCAAIGGIIVMNKLGEPDLDPNAITATLIIDYGNGTVEYYNVTTVNNSVPGLLDEAIGAGNFSMYKMENGVYAFEKIKDSMQMDFIDPLNPGRMENWKLYVDGKLAPNASAAFASKDDFVPIKDGQTVKLALEKTNDGPSGIFTYTGVSVDVIIDYGNGTVTSQTVTTQNFTALGCLETAVGFENLELQDWGWGWTVNGIDGIKNGVDVIGIEDTSNYYWMWYINDDWASVGADKYVCQSGDIVKFSFEESNW